MINLGAHQPFSDEGHDCPFKSGVEVPWVVSFIKFYTHMNGSKESKCFDMLYGDSQGTSLRFNKMAKQVVYRTYQ